MEAAAGVNRVVYERLAIGGQGNAPDHAVQYARKDVAALTGRALGEPDRVHELQQNMVTVKRMRGPHVHDLL